jgi:hypothetical protein
MIWWLLLFWLFLGVVALGSIIGLWDVLRIRKDGGPESKVTGYWLFECKRLFSVALLRFDPGWREVYHSHAFNAVSWVLGPGHLREEHLLGFVEQHVRSPKPVFTWRSTFHRVFSEGTTWVLTFRGPWHSTWYEYDDVAGRTTRLTHGRAVVQTWDDHEGLTTALALA